MQRLSAERMLATWEAGRHQHTIDRALTLLAAASPATNRDALADLSIGERDARLLQLRTLMLGPHAEGFAECPHCKERIEFSLDTAAFAPEEGLAFARPVNNSTEYEVKISNRSVRYRLPTSSDLAETVTAPDAPRALRRLIERCVSPHEEDLPKEVLDAISRAMLEADPTAEIRLHLSCPACRHCCELLFDIAEFLWAEIAAQAQRLLHEIDALARAYGWTEREILSLPARRRQSYLEMLAA